MAAPEILRSYGHHAPMAATVHFTESVFITGGRASDSARPRVTRGFRWIMQ